MIKNNKTCQGFSYISAADPKIMILGTMPSTTSLQDEFYYAHPRNAFWSIMKHITSYPIETRQDKIKLIEKNHLLLWDVLAQCEREGSLDSAIKIPQANDFEALLKRHKNIKVIAFNGQKAAQLFQRLVIKKQAFVYDITLITLPSTSPANASMSFADKQLFWQEKISNLL